MGEFISYVCGIQEDNMSIGLGAILSLAVGAANTFVQHRQAKKAAAARREGAAVQSASQKNKDRLARRRTAKEIRLKRARLAQSSENTGVSGSSGELGATSALTASAGTSIANQNASILASDGISRQNAAAASAQSKANRFNGLANLFNTGIGIAEDEGLIE